jgi:hypothetical protein
MNGRKLQVALLAGVLILANAQCLFACAADPCDRDRVPPCHKQQSKSDHATPSCAHAPVLAEYRAPVDIAKLDPDATGTVEVVRLPHSVRPETMAVEDAKSPPALPEPALSTVLRV